MEQVKNLENVKVGDKFVIDTDYGSRLVVVECTKVTETRAEIGGTTFIKQPVRRYGASKRAGWITLYQFDESAKEALHRQELRAWATKHSFTELRMHQIEQMIIIENNADAVALVGVEVDDLHPSFGDKKVGIMEDLHPTSEK
jgi:hypothetical protein